MAVSSRQKVFGLGLSKTGTSTLRACLHELGYRNVGYRSDLLLDWSVGRFDRIWSTIDANDSFQDWPVPLLYSDLMKRFGGDAFYILTVRKDAATWLESLKKHALLQPPDRARFRKIAYGIEYPQLDEAGQLARYEQHNTAVIQLASELGLSDRLRVFCWERGDGCIVRLVAIVDPKGEFRIDKGEKF